MRDYVMRLVEHTKELFKVRPRTQTIALIAAETGLDAAWVAEFSKGRRKSVDADKLQTLFEFLTGDRQRLNF